MLPNIFPIAIMVSISQKTKTKEKHKADQETTVSGVR